MDINLRKEELLKDHPDYSNLLILKEVAEDLRNYGTLNQLDIYRKVLDVINNIKIRIDDSVDKQILKELGMIKKV